MLTTTACCICLAATSLSQTGTKPLAVIKQVLFASEQWYQESKSQEKTFVGKLQINQGDGRIGNPERFAGFRLSWRTGETGEILSRPIHMAGKDLLLAPFVGQEVHVVGKLVDTTVAGATIQELWPARFEAKGVLMEGYGSWKILARSSNWYPQTLAAAREPQVFVIRNASQLAQYYRINVPNPEAQAVQQLTAALGATVDWDKQMIVGVWVGYQRGVVRPSRVQIHQILVQEKGLDVYWKTVQENTNRLICEIVLVPKWDKEIRFLGEGEKPVVIPAPEEPAAGEAAPKQG
jgi:hypothetical protein